MDQWSRDRSGDSHSGPGSTSPDFRLVPVTPALTIARRLPTHTSRSEDAALPEAAARPTRGFPAKARDPLSSIIRSRRRLAGTETSAPNHKPAAAGIRLQDVSPGPVPVPGSKSLADRPGSICTYPRPCLHTADMSPLNLPGSVLQTPRDSRPAPSPARHGPCPGRHCAAPRSPQRSRDLRGCGKARRPANWQFPGWVGMSGGRIPGGGVGALLLEGLDRRLRRPWLAG